MTAPNPLLDAALRLYHSATTPQQERDAYLLARAHGLPASYGETDDVGIARRQQERLMSRFFRWARGPAA